MLAKFWNDRTQILDPRGEIIFDILLHGQPTAIAQNAMDSDYVAFIKKGKITIEEKWHFNMGLVEDLIRDEFRKESIFRFLPDFPKRAFAHVFRNGKQEILSPGQSEKYFV